MKERPILFNDAMVRAILDGTKTQTRRPVGLHFTDNAELRVHDGYLQTWCLGEYTNVLPAPSFKKPVKCPFGVPGDWLWVRECWLLNDYVAHTDNIRLAYRATPDLADRIPVRDHAPAHYDDAVSLLSRHNEQVRNSCMPWRPSIHMPRWASRITLEVKRVWVERVRDVDHKAEGFPEVYSCSFVEAWNSIYAPKGYGWDKNPWVWGCEFERKLK